MSLGSVPFLFLFSCRILVKLLLEQISFSLTDPVVIAYKFHYQSFAVCRECASDSVSSPCLDGIFHGVCWVCSYTNVELGVPDWIIVEVPLGFCDRCPSYACSSSLSVFVETLYLGNPLDVCFLNFFAILDLAAANGAAGHRAAVKADSVYFQ